MFLCWRRTKLCANKAKCPKHFYILYHFSYVLSANVHFADSSWTLTETVADWVELCYDFGVRELFYQSTFVLLAFKGASKGSCEDSEKNCLSSKRNRIISATSLGFHLIWSQLSYISIKEQPIFWFIFDFVSFCCCFDINFLGTEEAKWSFNCKSACNVSQTKTFQFSVISAVILNHKTACV